MNEIIESIKKSTIEIQKIIAKGDMGKSEEQNSTGDTQLKLDIISDVVIENNFKLLTCVKQIVSEEQENIVNINKDGEYLIAYDPLDGSSLVDVNLSVGSIYGIFKNNFTGNNIIASVYVVFGPRVEMVVCDGETVKLYRMQNEEFNYIKDIKMDQKGTIKSPGSTQQCWYPHHKEMINEMFEDNYNLTYSGGMVPDLHHILLRGGGLFSYPGTSDKSKGKLRQLFEVFPFAHIFETAGGGATDGKQRVLEIETTHIHDTSPCFFGSNDEINRVITKYKNI
ncbi:MAG: class 1 fructose-bisphosphatase [Epsilonproteobacteria bacterium]|nr:MAG: class 1 fructose-bisphosphatase [Campylobacterota bacterium]